MGNGEQVILRPGEQVGYKEEKDGFLARIGSVLADWAEKWFPDAYVFAAVAVVIVGVWALLMGQSVYQISINFGAHFWDLVAFTMQAAFVIITDRHLLGYSRLFSPRQLL